MIEQTREPIPTDRASDVITRRSVDCGVCDGTGLLYYVDHEAEMCWFCDGMTTITMELVNDYEIPHASPS